MVQIVALLNDTGEFASALRFATLHFLPPWARVLIAGVVGSSAIFIALRQFTRSILAPLATQRRESVLDMVYAHTRRQKGLKVVAIGGGTGLPSVLRGLKTVTSQITAVVTTADDGGSSGKLRRELGVLPPGDLRSNIAALADDEALITQLFQYRFSEGGLEGHSFGNLFLTAMADLTGSMDRAVAETGRVLAIEGRVLPSTLQNVTLLAEVRIPGETRLRRISGESQIPEAGGKIERVFLQPDQVHAYPDAIRAILSADLVVIGPGSLFTSLLPNLLVNGIAEALRASNAYKVYVCNVATQPGETDGFSVTDHVLALEAHVGRNVFDAVLANDHYPTRNAGENTLYVLHSPDDQTIYQRYDVHLTDLTDADRPWRHDSSKLARALLTLYNRAPAGRTFALRDGSHQGAAVNGQVGG
ncbi:MAG TPA: YvcK family protein [Aggregatilinea sp.]|uniref:gluconeogenesis factor YvcK family protein n=1 Tax=Aggregatilinea sp. TaxID=2806333 RepID=UPI002CD33A68|nr:gluconeogenesis factor YvcK family protein [Aggregatilinea sp.]HML24981.1 YvcK family protein [Aggregatilinea sp.]